MFYEPKNGYPFKINPFKSIIFPRPIGWISSVSKNGIPELLHYLGEVVKKERLLETETPQEIEQAQLPVDSIWDDFI